MSHPLKRGLRLVSSQKPFRINSFDLYYMVSIIAKAEPAYILLSGLPGSGKSTLATELKKRNSEIQVISTDALIEEYAQQNGLTYAKVFDVVDFSAIVARMHVQRDHAFTAGKSIIHDQTNLTRHKRASVSASIDKGYRRVLIFVDTPFDVICTRLESRAQSTGKRISADIFTNFVATMQEPNRFYPEPFDHIYIVDGTTLELS
jgi:predicted kinase